MRSSWRFDIRLGEREVVALTVWRNAVGRGSDREVRAGNVTNSNWMYRVQSISCGHHV